LEKLPALRTDFVKGNKMKKINWLIVGIVAVLALAFLFGGGMMGGWGYRGGWGMMSGPGMMGGWGYAPFGWLGMTLMWLAPVGVIALTVLGITWLVQNLNRSTPLVPQSVCPNCGKSIQADWKNCPYCGTALK
jgi:uncharacterized membrane protein